MPWKTYEQDGKWCVHKVNADDSMGDLVPGGCHSSKADAASHARALYASEAKEITDATLGLLKEIAGDANGDKPERASAVLDEWEARIALIPDKEVDFMQTLPLEPLPEATLTSSVSSANVVIQYLDANGIVVPIPEEKAVEQREDTNLAEQRVADEKPVKKDLLARLKEIGEAIKSWFKDESDETGLSVWKEGNQYWWMARYSNKFRDRDNPPEIISSESHKRFASLVKDGKAPLPELWLWHKKEWKVGNAHGIAYDELGFAVAIGTFDVGKEKVAEALMKSKEPVMVSHGMPKSTLRYDETDPTIIVEHETREISPLPAWAAANKLTGFAVLNLESKEESMAIPDETKKEWISNLGINPETLESLEQANAADADKAISEGLESKETQEEAQPAPPETPVPEPEPEAKEVETVTLTVDQLRSAVQEAVTGIVAPVMERVTTLEASIKELKETGEQRDEVLKGTPTASLGALLGQFAQTAIGSPETRVDGRTSLAQAKPKEAAAEVVGRTKIPFIDEMLAGNNH